MFDFVKNKRGYTLVEVIVAVTLITTLVASYVNLFNGMLSSTTYFRDNMTAQMLAANRWKQLDLVSYPGLTNESRASIGTTNFEREVILGAEEDLGGGNKQRDVSINVYKSGSAIALFSAPKVVTSQQTGSSVVPRGLIASWYGSVASIPSGWQLCDGTNGTPDLRSRFIYGAGGDANTKTAWAAGWNNVSGHWPPWWTGGEENHVLTIGEMPSHSHNSGGWSGNGNWNDKGNGIISWENVGNTNNYVDGNLPHNIMPRFMALAYIMKL